MKKRFLHVLLSGLLAGALISGCAAPGTAAGSSSESDDKVIKVAASSVPHAEILAQAKDILAEEGYDLQVTEFSDYVQPNNVVESGEFDANYFQHIPYLESFNEEQGTHLVNAGGIHYEPFGIYPGTKASLSDIADGDVIAIPNDTTNEARALLLLQDNGILTLKDGVGLTATVNDITDNPNNVQFEELEAAQVARVKDEVAYVVLNGNYALEAGFSVGKDSIAYEKADSEAAGIYVNVIAVKEGNENSDKIKALVDVLKSDAIVKYINDTYDGAVIPFTAGSADASEPVAAAIDKEAFDALIAAGAVADDAEIEANSWAKAVKDAGVLRVGGTRTSFLFSQLDETDEGLRGFDAGLYQLLTRYILGDESKFELTQVDSSTRESVLQSDQVDAVFATYSITPARAEVISFAGPYYTSRQAVLVKKGNTEVNGIDSLAGKIVATQAGSTGPDILAEFAPEAEIEEFETDQEARTALEQGRVDAYVTDYTLLLNAIVKNPDVYEISGDVFGPEDNYGIGLPLDSDGVEFVNAFLKKVIEDGTWEKLWKISLGDRTGIQTAPASPVIE
ncbi:MAG: transporter substrate-binding domain-containing protein [Lachnospiraceae bacterium]|nr:transporter substrate-binding domain-containing protein [Lachnospiraceae bacterium]